jgi:two-component system, NarL family, nitrate/nitrite response regulator NarL
MAASSPIRVLLVDDHRTVLWGLAKLIQSAAPTLELADAVTTGKQALDALAKHRPNVVLLDLDLEDEDGLELLPLLRDQAAVIVLTALRNGSLPEKLVLQGARGVIHKSEPAETVLKAIVRVHSGETWIDRGTIGRLLNALSEPRLAPSSSTSSYESLSPAERKILTAVVRQKEAPNKVIAVSLHLSENTLRNHLSSIYSKLGIHRRMELVSYADRHKLEQPSGDAMRARASVVANRRNLNRSSRSGR